MKILSGGTFKIKVESTGLTTGYSPEKAIINYVKTIDLTNPQTNELSTYITFMIHLVMVGDDGNMYLPSASVTITCDKTSVVGLASSAVSVIYQTDFEAYATASGTYVFTASVTSGGSTITDNISYVIIQPKLKITLSATVMNI